MIINILVGIAVIIAFFIGYYLLSHLNKTLFEINVQKNPRLSGAARTGGITFILLGVLGILSMIIQNDIFILIVLLATTFAGTILEMVIMNIINHR
ncbi:MAG: hypothetical protein ABF723_00205 [Lentilactobacillus hilgardii]|jgi:hypothetical protein|uniref:DUF3784 domain-containing protein n=1 Tax=Lentilactobacillus hilgardii TaxID=1588 RepID=A0A6P1E3H2_LENHI|nr:hypothetical protein [Lentilactobacillus hilgardii]MCI1922703.1 hypothetical protein [Lentilactobacillus buchneri]RRG10115.1 MAG: hypothetical protein DUD35_08935 [Lactobacillus sp.]EEI70432.1 hypothetical protein HMPREF0496_2323 [Lentilactobacillus hilgardii ATCC 27305]MBZ2201393.1 hypothetical protein [Lentilactobacillus hilgardii]MBZ2204308.1 hypothetical protein [Lentilactobacillus hilgardii]